MAVPAHAQWKYGCPVSGCWPSCCILYFQRATCNTFQTCILNSCQCHTMCRSMVGIHSVTSEIRRGKKEEERKERDKNVMSASATHGGHNYWVKLFCCVQRTWQLLYNSCFIYHNAMAILKIIFVTGYTKVYCYSIQIMLLLCCWEDKFCW